MPLPIPSGPGSCAELLVQSISDYAIYMLDPAGYVATWNTGAERFKGYTAQEIIGHHFSQFYTEEDRAVGLPGTVLDIAAREGRFEGEGWRVRKDGTHFWAHVVIDAIRDDAAAVVGFAKVTRDATERRRAEEELRRSEERFRLLVEGVTDYAVYMLAPHGQIISWNAGAERLKGYTASEIVGQHFSRFYTPDDVAAGLPTTALQRALDDGHYSAEGWRVRKDGQRFWASAVLNSIHAPNGSLLGFAKITRDLTERREAQLALERSQEAFFQSQKLEAIGKLTGGVAHDFNNILAAILGSLTLAERRLERGENIGDFLANARKAAERGATLTQRMLAFARKQELTLEPTDIAAVVEDMSDMLKRTIGQDIAIQIDLPDYLPPVCADKAQLELGLLNLVVNARDAMPEGGCVVIGAHPHAKASEPSVGLFVRDEGHGMDAETLSRAVEPFFTTKGVGRGTGLGLSVVEGLSEQIGGRLEISSRPGEGTTAEIIIPIAEGVVVEASEPCSSAPYREGAPTGLDVLAVDDDVLVLLNTVMMLEDLGHTVHQTTSPTEALALLETNQFDLLITDYSMPGLSGSALIKKARALKSDQRAIVISGYVELPDDEVLDVPRLSKPFSESELAEIIASTV